MAEALAMTVEALARMTASTKLRERLRIADTLTDRAAVARSEGETALADALDVIAADLTSTRQIVLVGDAPAPTTGSPYGSAVSDALPTSASPDELDPMGDGTGLPAIHFNDDETDAHRVLGTLGPRGGYAPGSLGALMRD